MFSTEGHGVGAAIAIVRALAQFDPMSANGKCVFCESEKGHSAACLSLRARRWVKKRGTE